MPLSSPITKSPLVNAPTAESVVIEERIARMSVTSIIPAVAGWAFSTRTIRSPPGSGNGASIAVCKNAKVKISIPRPPASVSTVSSEKPGLRRSNRSA